MQYVWGIYLDEIIQLKVLVGVNEFSAGTVLYPLQDLLYRTTGLADTSSPPVIREAYDTDAYGNTLIFRNSGSPPGQITFNDTGTLDTQVNSPTCEFIFTGQRFDARNGALLLQAAAVLACVREVLEQGSDWERAYRFKNGNRLAKQPQPFE